MKDTHQLINPLMLCYDLWGDASVGSLLDIKACYHNIVAEEETQALLGVTT